MKRVSDITDLNGLKLSESENIKELLDSVMEKLNNEESLKDISPEAIAEFKKIVDAVDGFLTKTKNQNLKEELGPFVKSLRDMVLADMAFMKTALAIEEGDKEEAQNSLSEALSLRKQSLDYDCPLIDGTMKTMPA